MTEPALAQPDRRYPDPTELLVDGWRVIASAAGGQAPVVDAVVRLRTGQRSVIGNGEASSSAAALESAVHSAVKQALDGDEGTADAYERVRSQCALRSPSAGSATIEVSATATQREGLLNRVAALLNPYEVTSFDYERSADGTRSRTLVGIVGSRAEVDRAAQKLRRVIGVVNVIVRRPADLPT